MSKIFILMGKSASGKDTIYKKLLEHKGLDLKKVVIYTTRPKRVSETDGVEYYFVDEDRLNKLKAEGKVIEHRSYNTVHGIWHYFTVDDGQIDLSRNNYLMLGTPESYGQIRNHFGRENVIPIYIEVDDGMRLMRAVKRERAQKEPRYAELCRRFLADEEDFSEEKLKEYGITKRYANIVLNKCIREILRDIKAYMAGKEPSADLQ
ncbi:MAG: guanylate kinase [Clostridiales bacterium]|jgi:guanylate kinase|nr:guanylate kinase [Clostridiales bacterium]